MFIEDSFAELYVKLLQGVYYHPDFVVSPRGLKVKERVNAHFTLTNSLDNLFDNEARAFPQRYLAGELYWYLTGRNDLEFIARYSKFWAGIANVDGTVNSAYGHLLFKGNPCEWRFAYDALSTDYDTRQAILHFNQPRHISRVKSGDFPCTLTATFLLRDHKLNLTVNMRSQDLVRGLTFDLPFFSVLQQNMLLLLRQHDHGLKLGWLSLFVNSLHLYKSDWALARKMLLHPFKRANLPMLTQPVVNERGDATLLSLDLLDNSRDRYQLLETTTPFERWLYAHL